MNVTCPNRVSRLFFMLSVNVSFCSSSFRIISFLVVSSGLSNFILLNQNISVGL